MIPKAELHLHLEGSAGPRLIRRLAKKHELEIPWYIVDRKHNQFLFKDFDDFLKVYDQASLAIRTADDYYDVTYDYLEECATVHNVIYSELTASPDHAFKNGLSYDDQISGIARAIDDARQDFGIEARIIIAGVRHFGVDAVETLARTVVNQPHPYVVGFGLAGDETHFPPALFKHAFNIIHEAGLGCTAHAGEHAGPDSIWEAIISLPITRIGHGVRAIEDPRLIDEIKSRGITLECCPMSNIALGLYKNLEEHPLRALFDSGINLTLNSDDPAYFKTSIGHEYYLAKTVLKFSEAQLLSLTKNAIEACFAGATTKQKLLEKLVGTYHAG